MLARHGVRADKSLGQHFLVSEKVVSSVLARCEGLQGVLEVGPGPGVLTLPLSLQCSRLTALEIDPVMVKILADTAPVAHVVQGDALKSNLAQLLLELPEPRGIVSNMPYNITGPLLASFAACRTLIVKAVLMMQREVGEKILAVPGDRQRGALSVALQAAFEIRRVCNVPPGAFRPPPKVESIVLELTPKNWANGEHELDSIVELVRKGFAQPRKTLANNLSSEFGHVEARKKILRAGLSESVRPHQLTWEQWLAVLS